MHPLIASLYAAILQFAVGSLFATFLSDLRAEVTPGFLRQASALALSGAVLAYLLVGGATDLEWWAVVGLLALSVVYTVAQFTRRRAFTLAVGGLGSAVGVVAVVLASLARPSPVLGGAWTALTSVASALALGTALTALILGHWYLVTPRLSARPLRRLCDLAIAALIVLTFFAFWYAAAHPEATLGPNDAFFRWTSVLAITVFPIGITVAARLCCEEWPRGRAIQAATGLLYIVAALVLAGALAGNMVLLTART
jgi:hypothetical protein